MTTTQTEDLDLDSLVLLHGKHTKRDEGVCLLEAVAWIADEKHSDHPKCTDVALAAYGRSLNDRLRDDERQLLRPLVPKLVGTAGSPELAKRRAYLLVDQHVRVNLPAFFRELPTKPRPDLAERFEALPPVVDVKTAERARDLAREVRDAIWPTPPDAAASAAAAAYAAYAAAAYAAYAAAAAAADAAAAAADAAAAAADASALKELRKRTIARSIESFEMAIALTAVSP